MGHLEQLQERSLSNKAIRDSGLHTQPPVHIASYLSVQFYPPNMHEIMASSTKLEVCSVVHYCQRRT